MTRVLLVKMSSLGDVVHTLPALTDAAAHGVRFDWIVEEAFVPIAARHPGVDTVIPIAWRRWRRRLWTERDALRAFVRRVRAQRYDVVLDAQGLIKSAVVTRVARAPQKAGLGWGSAREGVAALAYGRRLAVPRQLHAIDRLRRLFAGALGYAEPDRGSPPDFGIRVAGAPARRCVLLHGTTWPSKHWPEPFWIDLARRAAAAGFEIVLPAGSVEESARAHSIAAAVQGTVWDRRPLGDLIDLLGRSALAVGVDSGLTHLAAALDVPTLALYGSTDAALTGCRGRRARSLQANFPCAPCRTRDCRYGGAPHYVAGQRVEPPCYSTLPPVDVWRQAQNVAQS